MYHTKSSGPQTIIHSGSSPLFCARIADHLRTLRRFDPIVASRADFLLESTAEGLFGMALQSACRVHTGRSARLALSVERHRLSSMELSIKTFLNLRKLRLVFVSNRKELFRLPRPSMSGSNLLLGAHGGSVCSRIWEGEILDFGVYKGMPLTV